MLIYEAQPAILTSLLLYCLIVANFFRFTEKARKEHAIPVDISSSKLTPIKLDKQVWKFTARDVAAADNTSSLASSSSNAITVLIKVIMTYCSFARLVIPVFRIFFFGPKKPFLTGFLRILFFLRFPEEFFTGTWFWRGSQEFLFFFSLLQEFFAGIPAGQEFLYLLRIPQESGGFRRIPVPAKSCWLWPATKEGSLLSKIWTKIDLFNLSPKQDLTMVSAAPVLCWRLLA